MNKDQANMSAEHPLFRVINSMFFKFMMLSILAIIGNFLSLELFFSVSFIFGSIATLFAVHHHGLKFGILIALIASSYTYILWGHPYAIIIFVVEAISVSVIISFQKKKNLVLADVIYWIFLGAPLIWLFYKHILQMSDLSAQIILIKQPLNGILNAVVATFLIQLNMLNVFLGRGIRNITSLTHVFNNSVALFIMSSVLLFSYLNIKEPLEDVTTLIAHDAKDASADYKYNLMIELTSMQTKLQGLYDNLLKDEPYKRWNAILNNKCDKDYCQKFEVQMINLDGTTEYLYRRKIQSQDNSGLPKQAGLKFNIQGVDGETLVFIIPGKIFFNFNKDKENNIPIRIYNKENMIIYQSINTPLNYIPSKTDLHIYHPNEELAAMKMWLQSYYKTREEIAFNGIMLDVYLPLNELVDFVYKMNAKSLFNAFLVIIASLLLAPVVSRRVSSQLDKLTMSVEKYIVSGNSKVLTWPSTDYIEINSLIHNFKNLIASIENKQFALIESNIELEQVSIDRKKLIENANVPIFGVDSDRQINEWNKMSEQITGFSQLTARGANLLNFIADDCKNKADIALNKALKGEETSNFELVINTRDGARIDVLLNFAARRNHQGDITGVLCVGQDITKRKIAEAQLIQSSKLATLGEMATGVAHELNQPLNVIRMAAGNSLRKWKKTEHDIDSKYFIGKLERINEQTKRAAAIIDHMRMFGRRADKNPIPIDIRDCIAGACELMYEQLRLKNIAIEVEQPDELSLVLGHKIPFEQVLLNLLSNSRDAMMSQDLPVEMKVYIKVEEMDDELKLTVKDMGGGLPEELLERIFEPFFTTKEVGEGTGLGLSVSYGIIKDMNGDIVASNTDEGLKFVISIPVLSE